MTERGHAYQIYGTYVEHRGRFCQGVPYHPIDRNKHHIFEFEESYAIKTEISAEARIMLGQKLIDTKYNSNDFYGVCTSVREVARQMKGLLAEYAGANINIVATIEKTPVILAPIKNPDYRREACLVPNDWWLAEDRDKVDAMLNGGRGSIPADQFPRRLEAEEPEEIIVWTSAKPGDFADLIAFASRHNLSSEKLDSIMEPLR